MNSREATKLLKGKKILKVKLNPFSDGRGGLAHSPTIFLEGNIRLRFSTEETENNEYGTELLIIQDPVEPKEEE